MSPTSKGPPNLRALAQRDVPVTLPADLRELFELPEPAQNGFKEILVPCLEPQLSEDTDRSIEVFCRKYDAIGNRVALAVRGARFVLWEAARSNASADALTYDLGALCSLAFKDELDRREDAATRITSILVPVYESAKAKMRSEIVKRSMTDHGALLVGVDWRVDRVIASQHGRVVDAPIAMLTLAYRDGDGQKRISLQCDAAMLQRLHAACDAIRQAGS